MPVAINSVVGQRPGSAAGSIGVGGAQVVNMNATASSQRPTTTSRRGGRSRSPVALSGTRGPSSSGAPGGGGGGGGAPPLGGGSTAMPNGPSPTGGSASLTPAASPGPLPTSVSNAPDGSGGGVVGENPSSAAAAAAAAAKAYSTGRGAPWQEDRSHGRDPMHPQHRPPYDKQQMPPHYASGGGGGWPGEDPAYRGRPPYPGYEHHQRPPAYGRDEYSDRRYPHHPRDQQHRPPHGSSRYGEHDGGRGHYGHPPRGSSHYPPSSAEPYHPHHPHHPHHASSHPHNSHNSSSRYGAPPHHHSQQQQPPPPTSHRHSSHHPPSERTSGHSSSRDNRSSRAPYHDQPPPPHSSSSRSRGNVERLGGGTTLVIGGATPIHLPKSPVVVSSASSLMQSGGSSSGINNKSSSKQHREGSAASVFRRADPGAPPAAKPVNHGDDSDSPSKILLSLRTPTTSFEELKKTNKKDKADLSPSTTQQQQRSPTQLFETQRSGHLSKSGSIDMAASFNLFNQSFDSFGDGQYFNVESTLQADSFGLGRSESVGGAAAADAAGTSGGSGQNQILQKNSSGGNFSTQFLAHSGSGALTIGYSPVNSFGNASPASAPRRVGSNVLMVGGQDGRSASPTQVLGMYSYSNGGGSANQNARPLEDSHLRMSVGSFGGQSMTGYNRPYGGGSGDPSASPNSYYGSGPPPSMRPRESAADRMPPFYILLRKYKLAFKECTFLLPGVKSALEESKQIEAGGSNNEDPTNKPPTYSHPGVYGDPTAQDTVVASRRVESSVCAFGGNLNRDKGSTEANTKDKNKDAIFRGKEESGSSPPPPATPPEGPAGKRRRYEQVLPGRYYENDSRLSWEFEEDPPVEVTIEEEEENEVTPTETSSSPPVDVVKSEADVATESKAKSPTASTEPKDAADPVDSTDPVESADPTAAEFCATVSATDGEAPSDEKAREEAATQAKMRYRCKLCGQPKQNHKCTYQQSLARSIGTMVYPAVNAFTADEPGSIAAPLSEMNNFVDIKDDMSASPMRPTPDRMRRMSTNPGSGSVTGSVTGVGVGGPLSAQVTPESLRSTPRPNRSSPTRHGNKKRMFSQMKGGGSNDQGDLLFVDSMDLKPEQFRVVTSSRITKAKEAYLYAPLPLPYAQRKRLSDNLFSLSNEIPKLTDECAQVLREAREKDLWDLAVAELMTQVIVIIHCSDRDHRFEGLRQYLLTLGIAC